MPSVLATSDDLSGRARIREAALRLFAADGIAATSIRAVAEEAGVSPGLIVHHFESKDGLCRAVDEAALDRIERAVASVPASERVGDRVEQQTQEIAIVIRDAPLLADYIGRALVERGAAGVALFERMAERARGGLQAAARAGNLQPGVDRRWAPLQLILLLFGPFLLRPLLEQDLGESLLSEGALLSDGCAPTPTCCATGCIADAQRGVGTAAASARGRRSCSSTAGPARS